MVNCGHTGRLGQFVEQVFNYLFIPGLHVHYFFFYSNRMQSNLISVWLSYLFMNLQNRVGCFHKVCLRRLEKAFLLFSVEVGREDRGARSKVNILKLISSQCQNVRDFVRLPNLAHGTLPPLNLVKLQRETLVV